MKIEKIISGGQTGVDRAALNVAFDLQIPCGGWCPKDRWAEDGSIPLKYPLHETLSEDLRQRTEWNVWQADATLILNLGNLSGGAAYTYEIALLIGKPVHVLNLAAKPGFSALFSWLKEQNVKLLNIAGPRESEVPGIYFEARTFLMTALKV